MFKNILIPTDGSDVSRRAIKAGVRLAQSLGAKVTGYYAIPFLHPSAFGDGELMNKEMVTKLDRLARTTGQKYLDEIAEAAKEAGVEYAGLITKPAISRAPWAMAWCPPVQPGFAARQRRTGSARPPR